MTRVELKSAFIHGADAVPVVVEVSVEQKSLPSFNIVGLVDAAVIETRERVRCAIRSVGYDYPENGRILVNLAPSTIRKTGSSFDLPIALGILAATGQIDHTLLENTLSFGELNLSGRVVENERGFSAFADLARKENLALVCSPVQSGIPSDIDNIETKCLDNISDIRDGAITTISLFCHTEREKADVENIEGYQWLIDGIEQAIREKRGIVVFTRPDKTINQIIANIPMMMPDMTEEEMRVCSRIHSCVKEPFDGLRPFRAPHHSAALVSLLGGGKPIYPGEVSLAHNGVLFLENLEEFSPSALSQIKVAQKERAAHIVRADGQVAIPSNFMFVATASPCPCGHYGNPDHECRCNTERVLTYQDRLKSWANAFDCIILRA